MRKIFNLFLAFSIAALSLIPAADARRISITKGYSGAPYTFNFKSSNTAAIRTAWAGGSNVLIGITGDSTVAGQSAGVGTAQAVNSWPMQMAPILRNIGINAGADNFFSDKGSWGLGQTFANFQTGDGRISGSGSPIVQATIAVGGNALGFTTTATIGFTPQEPVDTMVIWWRDGTVGRNFSWQVDSGSTTQINSTGSTVLAGYNTPISMGSLGTHTINLAFVLGPTAIVGVSTYNSTRGKELSLLNWGVAGANAGNQINNTDPATGRLTTLNVVKPPGVFYEGGINDWRSSRTVATFKADVVTYILQVKTNNGNPILLTPVFDPSSTGLASIQDQYVQALYQIAAEYDIPLVDIRKKWISNANAVALGYQPAGDVHPTTAGYADMAQVYAKVVQAIINNTFADNDFPKEEKTKFAIWMKDVDTSPANDNIKYYYSRVV